MPVRWEKVHVFISSTFNDMHAERDYLVKQVFPELQEWCEKRRLKLIDIDLRWGVTESDAIENKNVVKVCLERIDDCRPFFLCLLGQRRGWVPGTGDVSQDTLDEFPGLEEHLGRLSITEMEILHSLMNPMRKTRYVQDSGKPQEILPSKHAFFFLRDPSYLIQLPAAPAGLREIYTNDGIKDEKDRKRNDDELKRWIENLIPNTQKPVYPYNARWNPEESTPELALPLADLEYNKMLTSGRLCNFTVKGRPLKDVILDELKSAIEERHPDHLESRKLTPLQSELDQQEQFLFVNSEGFISRGDDFTELDGYIDDNSNKLFVLTAPAGMGKTMLLANWINRYFTNFHTPSTEGNNDSLHYRFIGASDGSTNAASLIHSILEEIKETTCKLEDELPAAADPDILRERFGNMLRSIGRMGKTVIVIDGLNQLESGLSDLAWLPRELPDGVRLIVSFKTGDPASNSLSANLKNEGKAVLSEVRPFISEEDRRKLVKAYLSQYLKDLDERHIQTLVCSPGSVNPLFLKTVLSELRVFGSFDKLGEKIMTDFGDNPVSAFEGVLKRLEDDPAYIGLQPKAIVPYIFGLMANARRGLSLDEMVSILVHDIGSRDKVTDAIHLYMRQLRPFIARRDKRYDFFYESFRIAAQKRYADRQQHFNSRLADCFKNKADVRMDGTWQGNSPRAFTELPFHLAGANKYNELQKLLQDIPYLEARCSLCDIYELLRDYRFLEVDSISRTSKLPENTEKAAHEKYRDFIYRNAQKLSLYKNLFFSLLRHEGFDEAKKQSDILVSSGKWKKAWLETEAVKLPQAPDTGTSVEKVEVTARFEYERSCAVDAAENMDLAFYVKRVGQIAIVDTSKLKLLENIITARNSRPLVISCSANAKFLAIAYENGEAEIIRMVYDYEENEYRFRYQSSSGVVNYYLPEFEDPIMHWEDETLWYQKNEKCIVKTVFCGTDSKAYEYLLPDNSAGEVSGFVSCEDGIVFAMRRNNTTVISKLHNGCPEGYIQLENADVFCTLRCSSELAAFALTDGTIRIVNIAGTPFIVTQVAVSGQIKRMAFYNKKLIWASEKMIMYNWDLKETQARKLADEGELYAKTLAVSVRRLYPRDDGTLKCITDMGIFDLSSSSGNNATTGTVRTLFSSADGRCCGIFKRAETLWAIDSQNGREYRLVNEASHLYITGMDGRGNILAAYIPGDRAIMRCSDGTLKDIQATPPSISSIAGSWDDQSFWLCDRYGAIYHLSPDGNCKLSANLSRYAPSGPSITAWPGLVAWQATSHYSGSLGTDANFMIAFFTIENGKAGNLKMQGNRLFTKAEGHLLAIACDHINMKFFVIMSNIEEQVLTLKHGSIHDFIDKCENEFVFDKNIRGVVAAVYVHKDHTLYMLNQQGFLFAVDSSTFEVKAVLSASAPLTHISPVLGSGSCLYVAEGEKEIYKCGMEVF